MNKTDIRNLSYEEWTRYCASIGEQPFRAGQIFEWIYKKGVWSFDEMRNLPAPLRQRLSRDFDLKPLVIVQKQVAQDGTTKFLFDLEDHEKIETVLIPTKTRTTVCISTQAGCKFGCRFCASGIGGWKRNLSCAEILSQILHVKEESKKHQKPLSHIVCMGTGESFDNYDNLLKALRIVNDARGINIGARRITISTVGLIPKIMEFAQEDFQVELAISLHGYNDESRDKLMPVNKKYPFTALMNACRAYIRKTHRQITFEYILIKDITCTEEAARELAHHLKGMICKLNLIPYNPVRELPHKPPTHEEMQTFQRRLKALGIHATLRTPRGRDIAAACGQLRHASRKSKEMA
ncbi:MAG TPA: 23S rRNA (adenine(2503)-C(2))-methyltransferase RlmN [Candidatus Omnitrophica bacterium]|nr:23S rRNA (adenine(2503)-C(2))-methyltransferase RlmN [Candidatus Omnitrophota bacterium]